MKRQTKKKKHASDTKNKSKKPKGQRDILGMIRTGAIVTLVAVGLGWFVIDQVTSTLDEQDLTKIGNGIPTIVQIHDPQCSQCMALQREARKALQNFNRGDLQYLVANIRNTEGRVFANKHQVSHVTLLLFDKKGRRQSVLNGPNQSSYLQEVFQQHLDKFGR
ncbi:MAG: hypothetical protein ABJN40_00930 [Sneathiella sp.]